MRKKQDKPQYIFLFILDAVRKDHLSLYGYQRKTTPNIDKLAKQAEIYNFAISPSSYTHAAIPSILTGKYPFQLNNPFYSWHLDDNDLDLINQIKKNGFKISLFTGHISTSRLTINFSKYFDYIYDELTDSEINRKEMLIGQSKNIIKALINYLKKNKNKKEFIIIHLMEAHGPYSLNYKSIFNNDKYFKKDKRKIERIVFDDLREVSDKVIKQKIIPKYQIFEPIYDNYGNIEDFNPNVKYYLSHYDMGIYTQDKYIGIFLNFLKKNNLYDNSTISITSDHGELIGEDNIYFSHGIYTHPALINVPLIIKWPYQRKEIINQNNFSTQYLLFKLIKELKIEDKNIYLNNGGFLSFTSQSFSFLKEDYLVMIHNGIYHFSGCFNNTLFKIWTYKNDDLLKNFINLNINPHLKIFKKNKNNFKEVHSLKRKYIKDIIWILLNIFKLNSKELNNFFKNLEIEILKIKDELIKKNQEIFELNTQLSKIYNSKTWKLLYWYKKLTSFFKKK